MIETCAADGLCATACPVSIDTGSLIKRFRRLGHSENAQRRARWVAEHFRWLEIGTRLGLRAGHWAQAVFGGAGHV